MKLYFSIPVISSLALLTGCATQSLKSISYDQAMDFENKARASYVAPQLPAGIYDKHYAQPLNKKEACLVPMAKQFSEEPNFKSYWHGECKSGYAYGLGRDFMVSDIRTIEDITVYAEGAKSYDGRNSVMIDYSANKWVHISSIGEPQTGMYTSERSFTKEGTFLNVKGYFQLPDKVIQFYSLPGSKYPFLNVRAKQGNVGYELQSLGVLPNSILRYTIQTTSNSGKAPFIAYSYKNGQFMAASNNGGSTQLMELPENYRLYLESKLSDAMQVAPVVDQRIAAVREMEERYLQNVCKADIQVPAGIPADVFTRICQFRTDIDSRLTRAIAKADTELDSQNFQLGQQNAQASAAARQQQQARAQSMQELQTAIDGFNQSAQQWNQNAAQSVQSTSRISVPQVQSFEQPRSTIIHCNRVTDNMVNCR